MKKYCIVKKTIWQWNDGLHTLQNSEVSRGQDRTWSYCKQLRVSTKWIVTATRLCTWKRTTPKLSFGRELRDYITNEVARYTVTLRQHGRFQDCWCPNKYHFAYLLRALQTTADKGCVTSQGLSRNTAVLSVFSCPSHTLLNETKINGIMRRWAGTATSYGLHDPGIESRQRTKYGWGTEYKRTPKKIQVEAKFKGEVLDRTLWWTRFGRGYGPVVRETTGKIINVVIFMGSSSPPPKRKSMDEKSKNK